MRGPITLIDLHMSHRNALRVHRKKWGLSQREVAHLLGLRARSVVSVYEAGWVLPSLRVLIAYQFMFGAAPDELFPGLKRRVEQQVARRAVVLDRKYRARNDAEALQVKRFLQQLVEKSDSSSIV